MTPHYERIAHSLVARHPKPIGVVEFYGGQFFGLIPATTYDYFLENLFAAGYTIIAVPFEFSFNHVAVAESLLAERDQVREKLPEIDDVPHFWVGHSLGCKFIALLEAYTDPASGLYLPPGRSKATARRGIIDEPSLLMAPDIGDTAAALPLPVLPQILDSLGLGVRPTRAETQRLIVEDELFHLTALISFAGDTVAGNASGSPEKNDVPWFIQTLRGRQDGTLLHRELAGGHLVPLGVRLADVVLEVDPQIGLLPAAPPAELERAALELLADLGGRRVAGIRRRQVAASSAPAAG
ncbi:DUF1350 family protein [Oscillochloris sp. ZM17-4]|uniref:DUF1350 family protein n=1 Tax=Oscillochloris sp. ZM17-4 TaxID=2866714 RepID=UPI001C72FD79|nr:DUF1350 family protein [Oscillochloris sp. ZM17-4]MBX0330963.1 DUF1350 family protein [Oscillochloris sp. ZM17-4]